MVRRFAIVFLTISLPVIPVRPAAPGPPPSLEGRWVLVEQTYGKGKANLADADRSLCLELSRKEGRIAGLAWRQEDPSRKWGWPAWVAGGRERPVEVRERVEDRSRGTLRLLYRVRPSESGDLVLEVEENYRLQEGGAALVGRVRVTFKTADGDRGSYTLHRRFERMP